MAGTGILDTGNEDIFDILRRWVDKYSKKGIISKNGSIQPKIFIRNGIAYRFVLNLGDIEFSYEVGDEV